MTYELHTGDNLDILPTLADNSVDSIVTDPPAGISFMGKSWDGDKGGRKEWIAWLTKVMEEAYRILKPGGHALVWALPKTSHWTATALEDAGFEIRDIVIHLFSTGFPKGCNISKSLDGVLGKQSQGFSASGDDGRKSELKQNLNYRSDYGYKYTPETEPAKKWDGWKTGLKPAHENWILVRKPISEKTVAANVVEFGTGALNIGGCMVPTTPENNAIDIARAGYKDGPSHILKKDKERVHATQITTNCDFLPLAFVENGRYPANVTHDGSEEIESIFLDRGNYFYCAKVSPADRNEGCEAFEKKETTDGRSNPLDYQDKFNAVKFATRNHHPTVKNVNLMRYLCRLITPPNGTILDMFMGSGSTGKAAMLEGFNFIGIEQNPEYVEIAEARIKFAKKQYDTEISKLKLF